MVLRRRFLLLCSVIVCFSLAVLGQERRGNRQPESQPSGSSGDQAPKSAGSEAKKESPEPSPVITHHEIHVGDKLLRYTATAGLMPIRNTDGEVEANMFFIAYTLDGQTPPERRPLTFSFNGGPGSASVWLHLGAIGPKRVKMQPEGMMPCATVSTYR